jgi:enoyl-CoA hydratase/carnithine racemase
MSAEEGERWGFFNRLVPPEALLDEAQKFATRRSPTARRSRTRMTKNQLHQEWSMGVDEAIEAEAQAQAICMQTQDFERAYRAFAAKREAGVRGQLTTPISPPSWSKRSATRVR